MKLDFEVQEVIQNGTIGEKIKKLSEAVDAKFKAWLAVSDLLYGLRRAAQHGFLTSEEREQLRQAVSYDLLCFDLDSEYDADENRAAIISILQSDE